MQVQSKKEKYFSRSFFILDRPKNVESPFLQDLFDCRQPRCVRVPVHEWPKFSRKEAKKRIIASNCLWWSDSGKNPFFNQLELGDWRVMIQNALDLRLKKVYNTLLKRASAQFSKKDMNLLSLLW